MKFSIITPTYKRQVELERCIKSVLEQSYKNWEMIVVDDSGEPSHTLTSPSLTLAKTGTEQKVKYFVNEKNMGNNFSKNFAFAKISEDSDYIIFLDDDDWLSGNALFELNEYLEKYKIENNKNIEWLITERVQMGENLAKPNFHPNHQEKNLNYFLEYLLLRKIKGDKTHIISTKIKIPRFSKKVKNGEEWFFFCQIPYDFKYVNLPTTLSNGYSENGLNSEMQKKYTENTWKLFKEIKNIKILFYLILRVCNIILKKLKIKQYV